jgi:6-phosphogluconolactonase (cycloisomerase 2 family)
MAMDQAGGFLYAANTGSFDISVFSIDSSTGLLTAVPQTSGATAPIGLSALRMALTPSGTTLYVTGGQGTLGYIEEFPLNSGVLGAPVLGSPFVTGKDPSGLVIDPGGKFLYTANTVDNTVSEFTINADGSLTQISGSPLGETFNSPTGLLIDNSGKYLYVANRGSSNVAAYSIGSDGGLTLLSSSPFATGSQPTVIATDSSGKFLFVGNQSGSVIQSYTLDTGSGTLTSVASYSVPATATSIVVTP